MSEISCHAGEGATRTPVIFNDCFGWLHSPAGRLGSETAALICPGLMKDAILAHCSLRLLADALAAAGLWVLRFDYRGTGDSADIDFALAGGHWKAWQDDVDAAAAWLRGVSGARRLILCGLRAGGTLAALAAERRDDVAGLLLFEPVVSGQSYVRQLILEGNLQNGREMSREEGLEIREFRFTATTLAEIAEVDLRRLVLQPGQKVAVFARPDTKAIDDCVAAWSAQGSETAQPGWEGLGPLMRHPLVDEAPLADFSIVMRWLRRSFPVDDPRQEAARQLPADAVLHVPGGVESPMQFGADRRLFGMLCRPAQGQAEDVVILTNGGRDPHYGSARQNVALARRLGAAGIASLRFDFAGIGDSIGPPGKENVLTHTFSDRGPDLRAAIDALQARGFHRFSVHGLCSGAYHAFQGALADPRATSLMLINIAVFSVPTSGVADFLAQRGQSPLHFLRKLFRAGSWLTLFSGKTDLAGALRGLSAHLGMRAVGEARALARRLGLIREESFANQAMATLARRGVRTLFLFSPGEQEIEAFAREFGAAGAGLAAHAGTMKKVIPGMDHDLTRPAGRYDAETAMIDFVRR